MGIESSALQEMVVLSIGMGSAIAKDLNESATKTAAIVENSINSLRPTGRRWASPGSRPAATEAWGLSGFPRLSAYLFAARRAWFSNVWSTAVRTSASNDRDEGQSVHRE
jgi:hypothetical protein